MNDILTITANGGYHIIGEVPPTKKEEDQEEQEDRKNLTIYIVDQNGELINNLSLVWNQGLIYIQNPYTLPEFFEFEASIAIYFDVSNFSIQYQYNEHQYEAFYGLLEDVPRYRFLNAYLEIGENIITLEDQQQYTITRSTILKIVYYDNGKDPDV